MDLFLFCANVFLAWNQKKEADVATSSLRCFNGPSVIYVVEVVCSALPVVFIHTAVYRVVPVQVVPPQFCSSFFLCSCIGFFCQNICYAPPFVFFPLWHSIGGFLSRSVNACFADGLASEGASDIGGGVGTRSGHHDNGHHLGYDG